MLSLILSVIKALKFCVYLFKNHLFITQNSLVEDTDFKNTLKGLSKTLKQLTKTHFKSHQNLSKPQILYQKHT